MALGSAVSYVPPMRQLATICLLTTACSGRGGDADGARVVAAPAVPAIPVPAATLAATFAPDLVGPIAPIVPASGDYAMALTMTYEAFPTMELHLSTQLKGKWWMTLAPGGSASACLGSVDHDVASGQYHYKPAGQREHRESTSAQLRGLAGSWTVTGGVATIRFDRVSWNRCGLDQAVQVDKPITELRCIGVAPTNLVTGKRLACEATDQSQLLGLGMPMTVASRKPTNAPWHQVPAGKNVMFGAPGLEVEVRQDSRAAISTMTFRPAAVTLVEADYRK